MNRVKIPKIIFQEWFLFPGAKGKYKSGSVPDHWKSSPESIKKLMPDWKYVLINEKMADKFVKEKFPEFYDTYLSLEYDIQKVDMARYAYLYEFGGIYTDLDIELVKPLDDLFYEDTDLYLAKSGNVGSIYTNSFLASKPKCKFWLECLKEIQKPYEYWMVVKHLKTMGKTGPLLLSRTLKKFKYDYTVHNIPSKFIMPCSSCEPKPCTKPGAYTIALEGSSWCGWDSLFFNACVCNWKLFLILIFLIILLLLLWYYSYYNDIKEWIKKKYY